MRTILRDDYEPVLNEYHEIILIDPVRKKTWLFDCDGVFTDFTKVFVANEYGDSKEYAISQDFFTKEVQGLAEDLSIETAERIAADEDLDNRKQDKLTAGDGIVLDGTTISADLVQSTGQGADKIMSQKAVTDTLFADNNQNKIQIGGVASSAGFSTAIGGYSEADTYGVAVGHSAQAAQDSVALGYASVATESNTVSVGSQVTKRRVVNVADPTNDQDAATKKYVDDEIDDLASAVAGDIAAVEAEIDLIDGRVEDIEEVIPAAATAQNQLADKDFVNSSIATNTAYYISDNGQPFSSLADLQNYSGTLTNNDYAFVVGTDQQGNTTYTRYKYNSNTQTWSEEYVLNNSSFTAAQWAAINSGIVSGDVTKIRGLANITSIGANLTLTNGELSATDTTYTAGTGLQLSGTTFSVDNTIATKSELTAGLATKQDTLTAGTGISIDTNNVISADIDGVTLYAQRPTGYSDRFNFYYEDTFTTMVTKAEMISLLEKGNVKITYSPSAGVSWTESFDYFLLYGNELYFSTAVYSIGSPTFSQYVWLDGNNYATIYNFNVYSYNDFTGTDGTTYGSHGLVPAPVPSDTGKFLKSDGTWSTAGSPTNNINSTDWNALWQ